MKYSMLLVALLSASSLIAAGTTVDNPKAVPETKNIAVICPTNECPSVECPTVECPKVVEAPKQEAEKVLSVKSNLRISVVGQGVAPMNTFSPAQAYALAKRAATADAYRLVAEKVKGVRIDGQDLIKNMMVKRSTVRTSVQAMVRNANVVETTFKEGLCEVEMEILLSHSDFAQ
ncbi:MAG: LPP20 family lipoprotein [Campylobacterota bacterium]|nr:LPP20 family lipoprotein [Campylobacterota bacterium]